MNHVDGGVHYASGEGERRREGKALRAFIGADDREDESGDMTKGPILKIGPLATTPRFH